METKDLYQTAGPQSTQYAGFGVRLVAHLIDGFIISLVTNVIYWIIGTDFDKDVMEIVYSPGGFIAFLITIGYFVYFESSDKQATIGKSVMGLKVVRQDGQKMQVSDAIIRYLSKILSAVIFMIGFLMVIFDDQKRALHDRIAKTYVVKV